MRDSLLFLSIVIFSLIVQSIAFHFTMASADEGYYVMDALKLERTNIPIADYSSRAPILLCLIKFFVNIFGASLFVFRLPIMFVSALSAGFLFIFGSRLFSKSVGVIAGFMYAVNPEVLWSGQQIKTEALVILFSIVAGIFLIEGLKMDKWYLFVLSGVGAGLAFVERHSAIAFMAAVALTIFYYAYQQKSKKMFWILQRGTLFSAGVVIGFTPFFIWIASHNFTRAFDFWFGIVTDILKMSGVRRTDLSIAPEPLVSTAGFFSFTIARSWILTFIEVLGVRAWLLLTSLVAFTVAVIQMYFLKYKTLARILSSLVVIVFSIALIMHSGLIVVRGTFRPYVFFFMTIFSLTLLYLFLRWEILTLKFKAYLVAKHSEVSFIFFWIVAIITAYSFWAPGYIRELIPPLTLAAAILVAQFSWKSMPRIIAFLGAFSIAGLYGTSLAWYQNPLTGGWTWTQGSVNGVSLFLTSHTQPNESIFTANPLPVLIAKRQVFLDLNSSYIMLTDGFDGRFGISVTPHELYNAISTYPPTYAVVDSRMRTYIYKPYPIFEEFLKAHYAPVASFGKGKREIQIWKTK